MSKITCVLVFTYLDESKVIRSLIEGGALSDILLFTINSMSWILRVSNDGSPSKIIRPNSPSPFNACHAGYNFKY